MVDICEQRTKPITSAKRSGWNGHRFLCVPHRSWGFNVCNKIRLTCVSRVIVFLCHPYRSWEFHDGIKYQCPGVTVPKCRRFWRALIWMKQLANHKNWSAILDCFSHANWFSPMDSSSTVCLYKSSSLIGQVYFKEKTNMPWRLLGGSPHFVSS